MCPRDQNFIDRAGINEQGCNATACMQARPCSTHNRIRSMCAPVRSQVHLHLQVYMHDRQHLSHAGPGGQGRMDAQAWHARAHALAGHARGNPWRATHYTRRRCSYSPCRANRGQSCRSRQARPRTARASAPPLARACTCCSAPASAPVAYVAHVSSLPLPTHWRRGRGGARRSGHHV